MCKICGYFHEGDELPEDFICPLCKHPASDFEPVEIENNNTTIIKEEIEMIKYKCKVCGEVFEVAKGEVAVCPKCKMPTRIGHKILEDGTKVRVCKNKDCGETF